jgi:ABC-2 type transport system permease protein
MKSLKMLTIADIRLFLREPAGAFFALAFPSLLVLLFGSMYGNQPVAMFGGYGTMDISMPGYTALILATVGLMNIPITTASYRETGVLRRLKMTPLKPLTYILSDLSTNLLATIVGMLGVVLLGWLIHHVRFEGQVWAVALALVYCFLPMAAIGYLIACLAPSARAAQIIGLVILYPMIFLSGAGMPLEILPEGIRKVSNFLPLTYVVKLLRGAWFGVPLEQLWPSILVIGVATVVFGLLAARLFKWE